MIPSRSNAIRRLILALALSVSVAAGTPSVQAGSGSCGVWNDGVPLETKLRREQTQALRDLLFHSRQGYTRQQLAGMSEPQLAQHLNHLGETNHAGLKEAIQRARENEYRPELTYMGKLPNLAPDFYGKLEAGEKRLWVESSGAVRLAERSADGTAWRMSDQIGILREDGNKELGILYFQNQGAPGLQNAIVGRSHFKTVFEIFHEPIPLLFESGSPAKVPALSGHGAEAKSPSLQVVQAPMPEPAALLLAPPPVAGERRSESRPELLRVDKVVYAAARAGDPARGIAPKNHFEALKEMPTYKAQAHQGYGLIDVASSREFEGEPPNLVLRQGQPFQGIPPLRTDHPAPAALTSAESLIRAGGHGNEAQMRNAEAIFLRDVVARTIPVLRESSNARFASPEVGLTTDQATGACGLAGDCAVAINGAKNLGVEVRALRMRAFLGTEEGNHVFSVVKMPSGRSYLVDPTFRQFFPETYHPTDANAHKVGDFLLADPKRNRMARDLLQQGFHEITPEFADAYMRAFHERAGLKDPGPGRFDVRALSQATPDKFEPVQTIAPAQFAEAGPKDSPAVPSASLQTPVTNAAPPAHVAQVRIESPQGGYELRANPNGVDAKSLVSINLPDGSRVPARILNIYEGGLKTEENPQGTWLQLQDQRTGSVETLSLSEFKRRAAAPSSPSTVGAVALGKVKFPPIGQLVIEKSRPWTPTREVRREPPLSTVDTIISDGKGNIESLHGSGHRLFGDHEVVQIHAPVRMGTLTGPDGAVIPVEYSKSGKAIILQQAKRGCTAACTAMLIADHGRPVNARNVKQTNMGNSETMLKQISEAGLKGFKSHPKSMAELAGAIQTHGPAIVSIGGEIGGHVIVVDGIDLARGLARVRDPFHGWEIDIPLSSLQKRYSTEIVQVTGSGESKRNPAVVFDRQLAAVAAPAAPMPPASTPVEWRPPGEGETPAMVQPNREKRAESNQQYWYEAKSYKELARPSPYFGQVEINGHRYNDSNPSEKLEPGKDKIFLIAAPGGNDGRTVRATMDPDGKVRYRINSQDPDQPAR